MTHHPSQVERELLDLRSWVRAGVIVVTFLLTAIWVTSVFQ